MINIFTTDDKFEVARINKSLNMAICLWEITVPLKNKYLKYKDDITDEQLSIAEDIFSDIFHELKVNGINLDELID